ncbi:putative bifunctional diguanylate cyclase/phosphodiesterase [Celerinatantimonas yamalensis]|uniref:GGDEF domain-containing protein n=1 Tax=Celerinatantimonas yamalensis TaxID=559956 RepID=A0ABW9G233_9GAMM
MVSKITKGWVKAPIPEDELQRTDALTDLELLDSESQEHFEQLVELAQHIAQTSGALFSLIDRDKQWVKASIGIQLHSILRNCPICAQTIIAPDGLLIIEDTHLDPRFCANPLVTQSPHIRAYLGCAILSDNNQPVGTLCVIDTEPRRFEQAQIEQLKMLANIIKTELWRDKKIVEVQQNLLQKTLYDPLTGLPGQQLFVQKLTYICQTQADQNYQLLILNIQRFRIVNHIFGQAYGDALLRAISYILQQIRPEHTFIARIRDDRFAILKQYNQSEVQSKFLLRLNALLEKPLLPQEPNLTICCSIGIAHISPEFNIPDEIINRVNTVMHSAPEMPNGISVESYEPAQESQLSRSFEIENKLTEAIRASQFEMLYQPIVKLSDGNMVGFEALIRWPWKSGEYVSPTEFIPIAESSGLIKSLTRWIIKYTCQEFASIYLQFNVDLYMSVNISSADLVDMRFTDYVLLTLHDFQLPPHCLKLEVTEHSVIGDLDAAVNQMAKLQEAGIRFAIDDFGTGHASLRYLQLLPAAYLKIDRSFIDGVTELERDAAITRATIAMAHSLGKSVIAEGVETWEQAEFLREHHAEYAQGWLYAKPMPIAQLLHYKPPTAP